MRLKTTQQWLFETEAVKRSQNIVKTKILKWQLDVAIKYCKEWENQQDALANSHFTCILICVMQINAIII